MHNKFCVRVIGVGNQFRSDDAVGLRIAQHLKKKQYVHVSVIEASGDGVTLMESWKHSQAVILVDAVHSGAKPGTIHRFDVHVQPIPAEFFHYSTHAFGVAEAIELARVLNQLPPIFLVYGIEGKCFEAGIELSPEVENAAREVEKTVQQLLDSLKTRFQ